MGTLPTALTIPLVSGGEIGAPDGPLPYFAPATLGRPEDPHDFETFANTELDVHGTPADGFDAAMLQIFAAAGVGHSLLDPIEADTVELALARGDAQADMSSPIAADVGAAIAAGDPILTDLDTQLTGPTGGGTGGGVVGGGGIIGSGVGLEDGGGGVLFHWFELAQNRIAADFPAPLPPDPTSWTGPTSPTLPGV